MAAAREFLGRSGLHLQPDTLDRILTSAAELDETPGLVRPITLNVIGYVLATGKVVAFSADAGRLVRRYIELTVGQPAIRDLAPLVLEQMLTEQGTKRPRSEQELAAATNLRPGEVRAVLNSLGDAGLARPLDPNEAVWELSHDFIARAVTRFLGYRRQELLRRGIFYAAPALLAAPLLAVAGIVTWDRLTPYQIRTALEERGLTIFETSEGLIGERNSRFEPENLSSIISLVLRLPPLNKLDLSDTNVYDLTPLKELTGLKSLDLSGSRVSDLRPLMGLTTLQSLRLIYTRVNDLAPLRGLLALQSLDLSETSVSDLQPLRALTALRSLSLTQTKVTDLSPLKGLTVLQSLDLSGTEVKDIEPLRCLASLRRVFLANTPVTNLEPVKGLEGVQVGR